MNTPYLEGPGGIPLVQQTPQGSFVHTKKPFAFDGGMSLSGYVSGQPLSTVSGANTPPVLASAATVAFVPAALLTQHTPTQAETINFAAPGAFGVEIFLEIITSGASSFVVTFGTNTKTTGTLTTGTSTGKVFMIEFVSDGTNWVETGRTAAM